MHDDSKEEMVEVRFKNSGLTMSNFSVSISSSTQIRTIRQSFSDHLKISLSRIQISLNGKEPNDDQTIKSLKIKDDEVLEVSIVDIESVQSKVGISTPSTGIVLKKNDQCTKICTENFKCSVCEGGDIITKDKAVKTSDDIHKQDESTLSIVVDNNLVKNDVSNYLDRLDQQVASDNASIKLNGEIRIASFEKSTVDMIDKSVNMETLCDVYQLVLTTEPSASHKIKEEIASFKFQKIESKFDTFNDKNKGKEEIDSAHSKKKLIQDDIIDIKVTKQDTIDIKGNKEDNVDTKTIIEIKATKEDTTDVNSIKEDTIDVKATKDDKINTITTKDDTIVVNATREDTIDIKATEEDTIHKKTTQKDNIHLKATKEDITGIKATKEDATDIKATKEDTIDIKLTKKEVIHKKANKEDTISIKATKEDKMGIKAKKEDATGNNNPTPPLISKQ